MKKVYIASPYTIGDNFVNLQRQIDAGNALLDRSYIPISPLCNSVFYNMQKERTWEVWMEIDYKLIEDCDALLRLPGKSTGADLEVQHAQRLHIPVFESVEELHAELSKA